MTWTSRPGPAPDSAPAPAQEKVRKVLDIWTRASTFGASALAKISSKLLAVSAAAAPVAQMSPGRPSLSPGEAILSRSKASLGYTLARAAWPRCFGRSFQSYVSGAAGPQLRGPQSRETAPTGPRCVVRLAEVDTRAAAAAGSSSFAMQAVYLPFLETQKHVAFENKRMCGITEALSVQPPPPLVLPLILHPGAYDLVAPPRNSAAISSPRSFAHGLSFLVVPPHIPQDQRIPHRETRRHLLPPPPASPPMFSRCCRRKHPPVKRRSNRSSTTTSRVKSNAPCARPEKELL